MRVLFVSFIMLVLDQVTKSLVKGLKIEWLGIKLEGVPYNVPRPFIGNFVKITFIENPGMALGLNPVSKPFLVLLTAVASILILYYIYKNRNGHILMRLSLAFILAGAAGNMVDRMFYGQIYHYAPFLYGRVVDFIQLEFWGFTFLGRTYSSWPILNLADLSVTIGFIIMIIFRKKIFAPKEVPVIIPGTNGTVLGGTDELPAADGDLMETTGVQNSEDRKKDTD